MPTKLQENLKAVVDEASPLQLKVEAGTATPQEKSKFAELAQKSAALTKEIDNVKMLSDAKAFGEKSDGNSAVKASFDRIAGVSEGALKGITADPKTGEMRVLEGMDSEEGATALEALKSGAYKDFFAQKLRMQVVHGADWKSYLKGNAMKILNEGSFTAGEAWIPPDFRSQLIKRMATMTTVRPNASVFTTGSDHITFPLANYTGVAGDDALANLYTSPFRATWQGSGAQSSSPAEGTNPIAGQIRIPVYLLTANIIVQREQVEDNAFDLLGYLNQIGAESFALTQEGTYTTGNGVSQPVGFLKHPSASVSYNSSVTVNNTKWLGGMVLSGSSGALAWGAAATSAALATGILGTEAVLPPQYESGAKWYGNKMTYATIRTINVNTATVPQWGLGESWPNYANNYNASLLGYKIEKNQFMPDVASSVVPLALGDMGAYYIADRVGFSVEVNPWIYQDRDQVLIYMRQRTGGQLVEYWKMKFLECSA